jgi:Ala-tRNA(Pro) deacylase
MYTETDILHFLDGNAIAYQRLEHPPVYTCEDADRVRPVLDGEHIKNIFFRDEGSKHFFLAVARCEKRIDSRALGRSLGVHKLHLGSPEQLMSFLGVTPGAVTILGLVNDVDSKVDLVFDAEIWQSEAFLCHPLVNTATLVISREGLLQFCQLVHHPARVVEMVARP